ncbi:BQ2448_3309 [Microbotryum intermedium]|uniref:BQ2448_3309 protein n=1 Tax=Microbotryum intermedium TaxID=269621 RepID=A0A238FBL3_9BASI|nr:BQ2448_3309 [Microbotryum intermedium]
MSSPSPLISPSQTPPPSGAQDHGVRFSTPPLRSPHFVSRAEAIKGLSNRFVFSWFYIYLYLAMAFLSLTTVVLSVLSDCPTFSFYMLEIIINTTMIAEVSIRLVAFRKVSQGFLILNPLRFPSDPNLITFLAQQFWKSYYNTLDLIITMLCVITLIVIFLSGCSAKGEEVFDVFLLVIRNLFQFGRLALVMRKSGKNVFTRPAPIDLSSARNYSFSLDLDLDDEEALSTERRALGGDLEAARVSRTVGKGQAHKVGGLGGAGVGGGEERPFTLEDSDEDE